MKKIFMILLATACLCSCKESMSRLTDRVFDVAKQQAFNMDARLEADLHPRSLKKDGTPRNSPVTWWCSGFFPGSVWYIYEYTGDESVLALARKSTAKLDSLVYNPKTDHDIGFQINCSYGNGYRLTGNAEYLSMMELAAAKLAKRFSPIVGCTKSWDLKDKPEDFPVIIDNMMNLELLTWSGRKFGVDSLASIACTHANTTMKNHFRDDYTTYHGVVYDPITGEVKQKKTIQGYDDESAWARGQAWALYGYTMMFRETAKPEYLDQAVNVANMILGYLPEDGIPYWDFNDPAIPDTYRDASAAAIMASAYIELSGMVKDRGLKKEYLATAENILRTLSSPEYLCQPGECHGFLLKHSVGNLPRNSEVDVPLTYADYYFLEALLRYKDKN